MKNLTPFIAAFFSILIVSCTVAGYRKSPPETPPKVVVLKPGKSKPGTPVVITRDTGKRETTVEKHTTERIREVSVLDTAALSAWLQRLEERLAAGERERSDFAEIMNGYRQALRDNNALLLKYAQERKEKAVAKEAVSATKKVMVDVPTIMYGILILLVVIVALRQQYLKVKLERQITNIRSCRIENQE